MKSSDTFVAVKGEPAERFCVVDPDSEEEPLEKRRHIEDADSNDLQLIKADVNEMKQSMVHIEARITNIEENLQKMFDMLKQALHQSAPIEEESNKADDEPYEEEEAQDCMIAEKSEFEIVSVIAQDDQSPQDSKSIRDYFSKRFVHGAPHPNDDGRYCTLCDERYAKRTSTYTLYRHLKNIHNVDIRNKVKSSSCLSNEGADSRADAELSDSEETSDGESEVDEEQETESSEARGKNFTIFSIKTLSEESQLEATEVARPSGNKHNFWSYYDRLKSDDDQTPVGRYCILCKKIYSNNTSTTVLRRHLKLSHDIADLKIRKKFRMQKFKKTSH